MAATPTDDGPVRNAPAAAKYCFAGEMEPQAVWADLAQNPEAALLDVRTEAEWSFVGAPDLSTLNKSIWLLPWKSFPGMGHNPSFFEALERQLAQSNARTVYVICRSGARSLDAARAAAAMLQEKTEATQAAKTPEESVDADKTIAFVNVKEGFEGDLDKEKHRGRLNGWKARGLPWTQS